MPIHDWTRVGAGTWHAFHLSWISEIQNALNDGRMPNDYYAQAEQIIGPMGPDVLTLQESSDSDFDQLESSSSVGVNYGGILVASRPPQMRLSAQAEMNDYVLKRRTLVIRHSSGDRIVALLEIVSPGNKSAKHALATFVEKAVEALYRGYHLLVIDLFPRGPRDPQGIHGAIWEQLSDDPVQLPPDEPLTLVTYAAGSTKQAYIEPTAIDRDLIDMPLFLTPESYVLVPLEETYRKAYQGVARRWRKVLEANDE